MQIINWQQLSADEQINVLKRPASSSDTKLYSTVVNIIEEVKRDGDAAIKRFTEKFDRLVLTELKVSQDEMIGAFDQVSIEELSAIEFAMKQIEANHQAQKPVTQRVQTCEGVVCERQARAIESVGFYIPGGTAPLISTVLMLAVPAKIAGSINKVLCTPPNERGEINPHILIAAQLCGIKDIYKVGGAQAIAAMAYGTETIPKVDKIFGPGNSWVTQAKVLVAQDPFGAAIDLPAGPSEVLVIADNEASCDFVAADLLSQAEHGPDSQVICITLSKEFAASVMDSIKEQLNLLRRKSIAQQSLANSRIIIANTVSEAVMISNRYAPEHLILQVKKPEQYISSIVNAGAVFLGEWSPETVGDYVTGSNHVLPTYGYARSYSGLGVNDFLKFITFQTVSRKGLEKIGPFAEKLAEMEGLDAHQRAVVLRLKERISA